jgi:hypothetical protein
LLSEALGYRVEQWWPDFEEHKRRDEGQDRQPSEDYKVAENGRGRASPSGRESQLGGGESEEEILNRLHLHIKEPFQQGWLCLVIKSQGQEVFLLPS